MIFDSVVDRLRGKALTVPPLDGAFRPNMALEEAECLAAVEAPDNLAFDGERVLFTSGRALLSLGSGATQAQRICDFDCAVSALAAAADGALAIGFDDGPIVIRGGAHDGKSFAHPDGLSCPVALAFDGPDALIACHGSARHKPSDWTADLMEKNAAGSVWRIDLRAGRQSCLARDLAFPYGILLDPAERRVIVSESWRHRLVAIPLDGGTPQPLLSKLPGYPARLAACASGAALLCLFAPRNRLIEFILTEDRYRADMMRELRREHWIAPALTSSRSFLEPLQCGSVRTMGIYKPWSPSRSYGLIVELDRGFEPVTSYHSRANGTRHGITSILEVKDAIFATSKGGEAILRLDRHGRAGDA